MAPSEAWAKIVLTSNSCSDDWEERPALRRVFPFSRVRIRQADLARSALSCRPNCGAGLSSGVSKP